MNNTNIRAMEADLKSNPIAIQHVDSLFSVFSILVTEQIIFSASEKIGLYFELSGYCNQYHNLMPNSLHGRKGDLFGKGHKCTNFLSLHPDFMEFEEEIDVKIKATGQAGIMTIRARNFVIWP